MFPETGSCKIDEGFAETTPSGLPVWLILETSVTPSCILAISSAEEADNLSPEENIVVFSIPAMLPRRS